MGIGFKQELSNLINARYAVIMVDTQEEIRAREIIVDIAKNLDMEIAEWSCTTGLHQGGKFVSPESTIDPEVALDYIGKADQQITIMYDLHGKHMQQYSLVRKLRETANTIKEKVNNIIIVTPCPEIPPELQKTITLLDMPLPTVEELEPVLKKMMKDLEITALTTPEMRTTLQIIRPQIANGNYELLLNAGRGLSVMEFENICAKGVVLGNLTPSIVLEEKRQIVKKTGQEIIETRYGTEVLGGLEIMKLHARKVAKTYTKAAADFGLKPPKGILLFGPPGTGKSETVKVFGNILNLPVVKLVAGEIFTKMYGETTGNFSRAIKLVSSIAPVIWWWDEVEKILSKKGGGHEESDRLLGTLLTDFEENPATILRFGTCNRPMDMDSAVLSRFQTKFFVDLPESSERVEIINIWCQRVNRDPAKLGIDAPVISAKMEGWAGREIRDVILAALTTAFDQGTDLSTDLILAEAQNITPGSISKATEIKEIRDWAKENAQNASRIVMTGEQGTKGRAIKV